MRTLWNHHKKKGRQEAETGSVLSGSGAGGGRFWNMGATDHPWVSSGSYFTSGNLGLVTGDMGMRTVFGLGTAVMALVICVGLGGRGLARWPLEGTEKPAYGPRLQGMTGTQIGHFIHSTHRLSIY